MFCRLEGLVNIAKLVINALKVLIIIVGYKHLNFIVLNIRNKILLSLDYFQYLINFLMFQVLN